MGSIHTWREMQSKKAERAGYTDRRDQVRRIQNSIYNVSDDYVSAINSKIDKLNNSLSSGIKGLSAVSDLESAISEKKEKAGTGDTKLSDYSCELASEIYDCQRKIDSLDGEISRLQTKYDNEVRAEREAARRAAEELANKSKKLLGI